MYLDQIYQRCMHLMDKHEVKSDEAAVAVAEQHPEEDSAGEENSQGQAGRKLEGSHN